MSTLGLSQESVAALGRESSPGRPHLPSICWDHISGSAAPRYQISHHFEPKPSLPSPEPLWWPGAGLPTHPAALHLMFFIARDTSITSKIKSQPHQTGWKGPSVLTKFALQQGSLSGIMLFPPQDFWVFGSFLLEDSSSSPLATLSLAKLISLNLQISVSCKAFPGT